ncbi:MAG: RNA 2',3'-cyclic phosphodiesterase [Candidatus Eisenbacteria bacterium]|nr:RNA 2',3'-cyclic phosphodiesterase [Candidatus Eisenbacteria bacterium]
MTGHRRSNGSGGRGDQNRRVGPSGAGSGRSRSGQDVRAFLALLAPPVLIDAAARVQEELRSGLSGARIRWVDPRNFHLTVRFFGDLGPEPVRSVVEMLQTTELARMEVRFGKCSAFPSEMRPTVLWVSLEDRTGQLSDTVHRLEGELERRGFGPPDKPWRSHLTLGRVPRDASLRLDPEDYRAVRLPTESFFLDELALMKSELRPQGPLYSAIETVKARV